MLGLPDQEDNAISRNARPVERFATDGMLEDAGPSLHLNESQRRHFAVVLAKLEDTLDEVDRLARPGAKAQHRSLTLLADDLPADFASRTAAVSNTVRARIADLAAQLGLAPQPASRSRTVRALLIGETVRLQDSVSRALKGYGALDPRAPDVIDPALGELISLLGKLLRALDAPPDTGIRDDRR